jgi:hypothetical protein
MTKTVLSMLALVAVVGAAATTAALADRAGPGRGEGHGPFGGPFGGPMGFGLVLPDFAAIDADGNGQVTKAELEAFRAARAAEVDGNGDGLVSVEELRAADLKQAEARATERAQRMIAAHDTDGDGQLSAAEMVMPPVPEGLFDRVDANGDGAITEAEIDAMRAQMAGRHEGGRGPRHGMHGGAEN